MAYYLAMPWQVLLSAICLCLAWGWTVMAGMFTLCWGALPWIGEFFAGDEKDLLLPRDICFINSFALLALRNQKPGSLWPDINAQSWTSLVF